MNPILFQKKVIDFMAPFYKDFDYVMMLMRDDKEEYSNEFMELHEYFQQNSFLSVIDFSDNLKRFLKENELTESENELFVNECRRTLKGMIINIDSAYERYTSEGRGFCIEHALCKKNAEILIEFLDYEIKHIEEKQGFKNGIVKDSDSINFPLEWSNKTELSELIFVLFHSKRVLKDGLPIQQKDLTSIFNKLFNTDIKEPSDLLGKTARTYKRGDDGQTFIKELNGYLEKYHDKKRVKQ